MAHEKNHDYHIINPSIWPFLGAVSALSSCSNGAVRLMNDEGMGPCLPDRLGLAMFAYVMFGMVVGRCVREPRWRSHPRGAYRPALWLYPVHHVRGDVLRVAWFWSFFKHALYPMGPRESPAVDGVWPPVGIETFDPWHLPLINTLILLCSGAAATWAHHALVHENNRKDMRQRSDPLRLLWVLCSPSSRSMSTATLPSASRATSMAPTSSWRQGFHGAHVI